MSMQVYVGVENDANGGLTHLGRIVKDAWMFGILPETETCEGWNAARMQMLYEQVYAAWEPYGHLPSRLPEHLSVKHTQLYATAISAAKNDGWDAELGEDE